MNPVEFSDIEQARHSLAVDFEAYRRAANDVAEATKKAFPEGLRVRVKIGRVYILGRVVWRGRMTRFAEPDRVEIINVYTGKFRAFRAVTNASQVEVLEFPSVPDGSEVTT